MLGAQGATRGGLDSRIHHYCHRVVHIGPQLLNGIDIGHLLGGAAGRANVTIGLLVGQDLLLLDEGAADLRICHLFRLLGHHCMSRACHRLVVHSVVRLLIRKLDLGRSLGLALEAYVLQVAVRRHGRLPNY